MEGGSYNGKAAELGEGRAICLSSVQRTRGWCFGADCLSAAAAPMMQFVRAKGKIKGEPSPQAKLEMSLELDFSALDLFHCVSK